MLNMVALYTCNPYAATKRLPRVEEDDTLGLLRLCRGLLKQMPRGPAADRRTAEQFGGNQFSRPPNRRIGEQMFDFVEQAAFEPRDLLFATGSLRRHATYSTQVLLCAGPGIFARVNSFGRNSAEQDQNFDFDRIVRGLGSPLFQLALPQPQLIGENADALHVSAERQRDDGMPCFVIGSGEIDRLARS
jgi:hypothetical protein